MRGESLRLGRGKKGKLNFQKPFLPSTKNTESQRKRSRKRRALFLLKDCLPESEPGKPSEGKLFFPPTERRLRHSKKKKKSEKR